MSLTNSVGAGGVWQIARPQLINVARSRWLPCYAVFFLLATEGLLRFTGGDEKTLLSLSNVVLFVVPLVTIVFGVVYLYNSREFIELLLAQPLKRRTVFAGLYLGLAIPLGAALIGGMSLPFVLHGLALEARLPLATMLIGGGALTVIFTSLAFCIALRFEDRLTGLGAAISIWLLLAIVYDGLVLFAVAVFSDHAIEKPLLFISLANPIDLVRIALLLQFDIAALMGYTGAVFNRFVSGAAGFTLIAVTLTTWIGAPLLLGFSEFKRKDF